MHFLGISSYPTRWQRLIWAASILDAIILLEGIGSLIWLMVHPSDPESRIFLTYSLERWFLIFVLAGLLLFFSILLWMIKFRPERVQGLIGYFEQPGRANRLLLILTFLFLLITGLMIGLPRIGSVRPYLTRLSPLLFWGTAIIVQVWLFSVIQMRQTIFKFLGEFFPVDSEEQIYLVKKTNRPLLLGLVVISLVYLVIQVRSYLAVGEAILIGDSWSYLQGASLEISDPDFFSERRPWAILLFYKLLGSSLKLIDTVQLMISTAAWLFLAWTFIGSVKNRWVIIAGFTLILAFSLTPTVQVWNHAVLSESLSISLLVLIMACFVRLAQRWNWLILFLMMLFFVLWMGFREANAYVALMVAVALGVLGVLQKTLRIYWLLSVVIGLTFLVNYQFSEKYALPRWALPLAEVITIRILPNQEYLDYFSRKGMPVNAELMAFSGRWANSDEYAIVNSVELAKFEKWLYTEGRKVYFSFLLTHPGYTIESPLENIDTLLAGDFMKIVPVAGYTPALPQGSNEILYADQWFWTYLWVSLFASGFVFATSLRKNMRIYWVVYVILLLALPHLYLVWHGDALNIARHAVMGNIQVRLGVWMLICLYLDGIKTIPSTTSSALS